MANLEPVAESYARMGWPVFPVHCIGADGQCTCGKPDCVRQGKHPATPNGFKNATTEPATIRQLWERNEGFNIGAVTSAEADIWVLDSDDGGEATIAELEAKHGKLPRTPMQSTPSGGIHRVFAWPNDGKPLPRTIRFAKGLDALGEGETGKAGYFILAPSVTPKGVYRWLISPAEMAPAQAPAWLLDYVRAGKPSRPRPNFVAEKPVLAATGSTQFGEAALRGLLSDIASAGNGKQYDTLISASTRLGSLAAGGHLIWDKAFNAAVSAGMAMINYDPKNPWRHDFVAQKVNQQMKFGARDPTPLSVAKKSGLRLVVTDQARQSAHDPETGELIEAAPPQAEQMPAVVEPPPQNHDGGPSEPPEPNLMERLPFRILGYDGEVYYYIGNSKGQITALKSGDHTSLKLLQLADLAQWQQFLGIDDKITGQQWLQIANALMQACHHKGVFALDRARGRGAWLDAGRAVVHTGSVLRIGSEEIPLREFKSTFVYEVASPWDFTFGRAATTDEAQRLVKICNQITWEQKLSAALLVGWIVVAPVCGALKWRPHIWVTGPSGSGKSTVTNEVIERVVGPAAVRFDGKSTEASVRQTMAYDALPALMDEVESQDAQSLRRVQEILDLARVASSGGITRKGGAQHKAVSFVVRSCFMFSSINTALKHYADESRVSRLVLRKNYSPDADAHYQSLMRDITAWLTKDFASAMFARTVQNLPTLLANIEVFTNAASAVFGSRRAADQAGAMLAGFYLCFRTDRVTFETATKFIKENEWESHLGLDALTDEMRLFQHIMSRSIAVTYAGVRHDVSIGQAILCAADKTVPAISAEYQHAIGRCGIKVDGDYILIANSSAVMQEMLRDTGWSNDWKGPLRAIPGAQKHPANNVRFSPGIASRATMLPLSLLGGE